MEPIFLTLDEVMEIHADQIERYGGAAGVRDIKLLQSALAMPQAGFGGQYLHGDRFEIAAAYLFHLVQNHPFVDGNKRVGATAALVFLELNRVHFKAPNTALVQLVLDIAKSRIGKGAVAEFFRQNAKTNKG